MASSSSSWSSRSRSASPQFTPSISIADMPEGEVRPGAILYLPREDRIDQSSIIHQTAHEGLWDHPVLIRNCQKGIAEFFVCTSFAGRSVTEKYNQCRTEETARFQRSQYRVLSQNNDSSVSHDGLPALNYTGAALEKLTYVGVNHTWKIEWHQLRRHNKAERHIDGPSLMHLRAAIASEFGNHPIPTFRSRSSSPSSRSSSTSPVRWLHSRTGSNASLASTSSSCSTSTPSLGSRSSNSSLFSMSSMSSKSSSEADTCVPSFSPGKYIPPARRGRSHGVPAPRTS